MKVIPIILCGGIGSRLWPISNQTAPKQFLKINNEHNLLQETILRVKGSNFHPPLIVGNQKHEKQIKQSLKEITIKPLATLLETEQRNTAPAIKEALDYLISQNLEDHVALVIPSDHYIPNHKTFIEKVVSTTEQLQKNQILTFGTSPFEPSSAYGYIIPENSYQISKVKSFTEKPDKKTASKLIEQGTLWNSGIFMFKPQTMLNEILKYCPNIDNLNISIDHAVMEHTNKAYVTKLNIGWYDLGTIDSIHKLACEQGEVYISGCHVNPDDFKNITGSVKNFSITHLKDGILITKLDKKNAA